MTPAHAGVTGPADAAWAALREVPDPEVPNGTVVQVVQTGYVIGDRVLRPALVGVSKGGPKVAPASNAAGSAAGEPSGVDGTSP